MRVVCTELQCPGDTGDPKHWHHWDFALDLCGGAGDQTSDSCTLSPSHSPGPCPESGAAETNILSVPASPVSLLAASNVTFSAVHRERILLILQLSAQHFML